MKLNLKTKTMKRVIPIIIFIVATAMLIGCCPNSCDAQENVENIELCYVD